MTPQEFYRLTEPTEWAGPPKLWSYSSLRMFNQCPLQWQLSRSTYGEFKRYPERPNEAAEMGRIVHALLSRLIIGMAERGFPEMGSPAFNEVAVKINLLQLAKQELDSLNATMKANPRGANFQPRATARDISNRTKYDFRNEYPYIQKPAARREPTVQEAQPHNETEPNHQKESSSVLALATLQSKGALSEQPVYHPELPIWGVIDLIEHKNHQTTILDFKTGKAKPEHIDQVMLYALLWWRSTGDLPARVALRYSGELVSREITEQELIKREEALRQQLEAATQLLTVTPSVARAGEHCTRCGVRQLCSLYWQSPRSAVVGAWVDAELSVLSEANLTGFEGKTTSGQTQSVVYGEEINSKQGPFVVGERLRFLGVLQEGENTLRFTKNTEVFHL